METALPVSERSVSSIVQSTPGGWTARGVSLLNPKKNRGNFFCLKIVDIYEQVFLLLKKDPTLGILFFAIAVLDLVALGILFLAPVEPVSYVLAPIIRTFYDDAYLHYPQNFLLLPKLFTRSHFFIVATLGILVNGLVIKKIERRLSSGRKLSSLSALSTVVKKYIPLLLSWLLTYFIFAIMSRFILQAAPKIIWLQWGITFTLALLIQSLAAFFFPVFLLTEKKFFKGILEGLRYAARNLAVTSAVISFPIFLVILHAFLKIFTPYYIRFYPELTLWVLAGGSILMAFVDLFVTSATTLLYLEGRNQRL